MKSILYGFLIICATLLGSCSDEDIPQANFNLKQVEAFQATAGDKSVDLTWQAAPNTAPTEYYVTWVSSVVSVEGGSMTVTSGQTKATVAGLTNGVKYTFSVQARYDKVYSGKVSASVTPQSLH